MEVSDNEEAEEAFSHIKRRKLHHLSHNESINRDSDNSIFSESQNYVGKKNHEEKLLQSFFTNDVNILSKPAVVYDDGKGRVEELCYSSLDGGANFIQTFITLEASNNSDTAFIGVHCDLGVLYPMLIIGILRSGKAFFNIDPIRFEMSLSDGMRLLDLRYILSQSKLTENLGIGFGKNIVAHREQVISIPFTKLTFYFYEVSSVIVNSVRSNEIFRFSYAYAIQTSGTTGQNKTVLVPHSCIFPNVQDFIGRWKVSQSDMLLGAAPPTFDPHIVELFVALGSGATILYTTPNIKLNGPALFKLLNNHCVSILQVTPSLFRRIYNSVKVFQLNSLRVVALGGEKCLSTSEINRMSRSFNAFNVVFQNIYGVTEVSSWASVGTIDVNSSDVISVGEGILETQIELADVIDGEGEIIISSNSRFCVVVDQYGTVKRTDSRYYTGDFGKLTSNGIVFLGRKDRIIKRNGLKVPLHVIEDLAMSAGLFSFAECVMHHSKLYLFVQLKMEFDAFLKKNQRGDVNSGNLTIMSNLSHRLDLPLFMHPDHVVAMKDIPVNTNGKIDFSAIFLALFSVKEKHAKRLNEAYMVSKDQVLKTLEPVWRSCTWPGFRIAENMLQENFVHVGGDSASAARFVESAFTSLNLFGSELHQQNEQRVLNELFRGRFETVVDLFYSIIQSRLQIIKCSGNLESIEPEPMLSYQEVFKYPLTLLPVEKASFEYDKLKDSFEEEDVFYAMECGSHDSDLFSLKVQFPTQLLTMYDFKLGLCVDASPAVVPKVGKILHERAIIGCHGGVLICIDLNVLRKCPHPASSQAIAWKRKFPNRIETTATVDDQGLQCYVGCHDGHLYKVNVSNGATICRFPTLNNVSIRSQVALSNEHQLVVLLDSANNIYGVNSFDFKMRWIQKSYKILATTTPLIYKKTCFVGTLDKGLVALNLLDGNVKWSSENNVMYSSPIIIKNFKYKGDSHYLKKNVTVILCETRCGGVVGLEAREIKKEHLIWKYQDPSLDSAKRLSSSSVSVSEKCCNRMIWLSNSGLKFFEISDGMTRSASNFIELKLAVNHVLIPGIRCDENNAKEGECAMFSAITKAKMLTVYYVHSNKTEMIYPWFMHDEFESFSKPVVCNEFIVFGGRDNKLHVIKCKI